MSTPIAICYFAFVTVIGTVIALVGGDDRRHAREHNRSLVLTTGTGPPGHVWLRGRPGHFACGDCGTRVVVPAICRSADVYTIFAAEACPMHWVLPPLQVEPGLDDASHPVAAYGCR